MHSCNNCGRITDEPDPRTIGWHTHTVTNQTGRKVPSKVVGVIAVPLVTHRGYICTGCVERMSHALS